MRRIRLLFCFLCLFFLVGFPGRCLGESSVSVEWKQRATNSLRSRILAMGVNPFEEPDEATSGTDVRAPETREEPVSLLSSLTNLLTQATTETISFSREIRPSIEWPKNFWNLRETEDWSWKKRFKWFRGETNGDADSATGEVESSTDTFPTGDSFGRKAFSKDGTR